MLQSKGIGPILKWVDDFIFFRLLTNTLPKYNEQRKINRDLIADNGGKLQTGGCLWYKGKVLTDLGAEHFREDCMFPIKYIRNCRSQEGSFPFSFKEIDEITDPLGIPWEKSKDTFQPSDSLRRTPLGPGPKACLPPGIKEGKIQTSYF